MNQAQNTKESYTKEIRRKYTKKIRRSIRGKSDEKRVFWQDVELMAKFKVAAVDRKHEKLSLQVSHRGGTSLIRKCHPVGPYSSPMPRDP